MIDPIEVTVTLEVEDLLTDVINKTDIVGESRKAASEEAYKVASEMIASQDPGILYQLYRSMDKACDELRTALGKWLTGTDTSVSNHLSDAVTSGKQYIFKFSLPTNYNLAAAASLRSSMHAYITYVTLTDWFLMTNPGEAASYATLSEKALRGAQTAIYSRSRPKRPSYYDDRI